MLFYSKRSREEELLDKPNIDKRELFKNLEELDTINRLLGGHNATLRGLKQLMNDKSKVYRIVDFACGGGDTLKVIHDWAEEKGFKVELIGFDLIDNCIEFAKTNSKGYSIKWLTGDFKNIQLQSEVDIAICSLVCHHLYDTDLELFIKKMLNTSKVAILINDLHRHVIAYYGIWILTALFSQSKLVKNDARLSVKKGFLKKEWESIFQKLGINIFSIQWIWAFRHLIIIKNDQE